MQVLIFGGLDILLAPRRSAQRRIPYRQSRSSGGLNFIQTAPPPTPPPAPNCHSRGSSVKGPRSQRRVPATLCSLSTTPEWPAAQPGRDGGSEAGRVQTPGPRKGAGRPREAGLGRARDLQPTRPELRYASPRRPAAGDHAPAHPSPSHQTHTY